MYNVPIKRELALLVDLSAKNNHIPNLRAKI
jgi:hypothetical protein